MVQISTCILLGNDWTFDCSSCGVYDKNLDDGEHSIACEKCNVWQHSKCLGISKAAAEKADFHFVCVDRKRKEDHAKKELELLRYLGPYHPAVHQSYSLIMYVAVEIALV